MSAMPADSLRIRGFNAGWLLSSGENPTEKLTAGKIHKDIEQLVKGSIGT